MCRDNRHCPPDCCKKKKKKIIYQACVVPRKKKSFVSKETSESFPGLNRAKISILFGPTTKLPLHCSATAIYIQDGNMVIVIKPLREFLRRLRAISRGSRRLGGLFSPIFLADRFLSSPPALPFPLLPSSPDDGFSFSSRLFSQMRKLGRTRVFIFLRLKLINYSFSL